MGLNFEGVVVGALSLVIIGSFHPLVIWFEYHFTQSIWPVFLIAGLLLQLPDTPYAGNAQQPQKNREKALDEKRNDQAEQAGDQKYRPASLCEVILKPDHQRME